MSKVFLVKGKNIEIPGDIEEYNLIKNEFLVFHDDVCSRFCQKISILKNIDELIENVNSIAYSLFYELYGHYEKKFISFGRYDFSKEDIQKNKLFEYMIEPFEDAVEPVVVKKMEAVEYLENEKNRRALRKENRGRVVGGGFGLTGSLKGMAQAEAINLGTGLAHSAWNAVGNIASKMEASSMEDKAFREGKKEICLGFYESAFRVLDIVVDELDIHVDFDVEKNESIVKNIQNKVIGQESMMTAFTEAVRAYPYNGELYTACILLDGSLEKDLVGMAKYFGADLGDEYKVNGFEFSNQLDRSLVIEENENIYKLIDLKIQQGFSKAAHEDDYLLNGLLLMHTNIILYVYREYYATHNAGNKEISDYREYIIGNFVKIREEILNFADSNGYYVSKLAKQEKPDDIIIKLAQMELTKEHDYFYYGGIFPKKKYDNFVDGKGCADSECLLFVYDGRLDKNNFLLCDKGFYSIQDECVCRNDIQNVFFKKRPFGCGCYFKVNNVTVPFELIQDDVESAVDIMVFILKNKYGMNITTQGISDKVEVTNATETTTVSVESDGVQAGDSSEDNITSSLLPFYLKTWFIAIWMFLFFPVGILLVIVRILRSKK